MTVFEAARVIQRAQGVRWEVALSWAHACRKEAALKAHEKQAAFFEARRARMREEKFLERLRAARVLSPARLKARRAGEGGWGVVYLGPRREEVAA